MSIPVIEDHERFPCVHCGERLCHHKGYGPVFGLCYECGRQAANLFSLAHSGEPLFRDLDDARTASVLKPVKSEVRWAVLRRDNYSCQQCGETDRPLHVDHIVARANGGTNDESNLQALCDKCNLRKGAK